MKSLRQAGFRLTTSTILLYLFFCFGTASAVEIVTTNNIAFDVLETNTNNSLDHWAIRSISNEGDGVFGWGKGSASGDTGVTGRGENGYGVYGFSRNGSYGFYTPDDLYVGGSCNGCSMAYIAQNVSDQTLQVGDVLRTVGIANDTTGSYPIIQADMASADEPVLGVVKRRVEMVMLPQSDDVKAGIHFVNKDGEIGPGDLMQVVVQGLAQVRVTATASLRTGETAYADGLTVSQNLQNARVGMAMSGANENGLAWVLVGISH